MSQLASPEVFFTNKRAEFIAFHPLDRRRPNRLDRRGQRLRLGFNPVHHGHMTDAQQPFDAAKAHPFQVKFKRLLFGGFRVAALIPFAKRAAAILTQPALPPMQAGAILHDFFLLAMGTFHPLKLP